MEDNTKSDDITKLKCAVIFYHKDAARLYQMGWVKLCAESIAAQTYKDFDAYELDYGNDGQLIPFATYEQKPIDNYTQALNYLHDTFFAKGYDVIFNTNVDDRYELNRFEKQLEAINQGAQLVSSNYIQMSSHGLIPMDLLDKGDIGENLMNNVNVIAHPVTAMHKSFWEDSLKYIDGEEWEDLNLWKRAYAAGKKFVILPDYLLFYRLHQNQVTQIAPKKIVSSFNEEKMVEVKPEPAIIWEKPDTTSRGVLLFATGNPYYGDCALRLAAALKVNEPGIKITLVADAPAMLGNLNRYVNLFDKVITPRSNMLYQNGQRMDIRAKIYADELSPYYETLMLDVDMMWLSGKRPSDFFKEIEKDADICIQNTGFADLSKDDVDSQLYYYWAKISEVKTDYGFTEGKFFQYTGEWVYFKKTDKAKAWFEAVREVYDSCKVKNIIGFANQTCNDELAYSIASVITGTYSNRANWLPVYWPGRSNELARMIGRFSDINKQFFSFSMGGNTTSAAMKEEYSRLAKAYFSKLKIVADTTYRDKKSVLPERRKL